MQSLNDIRGAFLDYFGSQGHEVVPSAPLVPQSDPTLLFVNAGMVPFKNVFTGAETRSPPRAASSQKCVRAGGKHNDLDNVGYTARHHTFFEMLGNFSFGDYFKERAIELAWTLITRDFGLPKDKLTVTVYAEDDEAHGLWKKIAGLSDDRIIRIATSDNFWSMGDTGPCGPCSEIFYDHGAHIPGGPPGSVDQDGDRFVEIWNLVFMQYEQFADGSRTALPRPSIDTGMGLERLAAVLQGVSDNYDTDLFKTLIGASEALTGVKAVVNALTGMGFLFTSQSLRARLLQPPVELALRLLLNRRGSRVIFQNRDDFDALIAKNIVAGKKQIPHPKGELAGRVPRRTPDLKFTVANFQNVPFIHRHVNLTWGHRNMDVLSINPGIGQDFITRFQRRNAFGMRNHLTLEQFTRTCQTLGMIGVGMSGNNHLAGRERKPEPTDQL